MATKLTKLTNLDTKGVAVVTAGANNKRIAFAKSKDGNVTIEDLFMEVITKGAMPLDEKAIEDLCAGAGLDPQMVETVKAIVKLKHVYRDNDAFLGVVKQLVGAGQEAPMPAQEAKPEAPKAPPFAKPEEKTEATPAQAQASDEEQPESALEEGDEEETEMSDKKDEAVKSLESVAKAAQDKAAALEAVIKSKDEQLAAMQEAVKANTESVKKMQDDARLARWVAKAQTELAFIAGKTADELGKMLFDIDTGNAEAAKSTFEAFKAQSEIAKSSNIFRPIGVVGGAPAKAGSAWAEVEEKASALVSKSGGNLPQEVALAKARNEVLKSDPALYQRYCAEQAQTNRAAFN